MGKKFKGIAHPRAKSNDFNGYLLNKNDMDSISKKLIGHPLVYEHNDDINVGSVLNTFLTPDHKLGIECEFYDTPEGYKAYDEMRQGVVKGLSLGMNHLLNKETLEVLEKEPFHLALCRIPNLADCYITEYEDLTPQEHEKQESVKQIIMNSFTNFLKKNKNILEYTNNGNNIIKNNYIDKLNTRFALRLFEIH